MSEDVGNMTVAVSQQSGILARNLIVSLRTLDGTAVGESDNELSSASRSILADMLQKFRDFISHSSWDGLSRYSH